MLQGSFIDEMGSGGMNGEIFRLKGRSEDQISVELSANAVKSRICSAMRDRIATRSFCRIVSECVRSCGIVSNLR